MTWRSVMITQPARLSLKNRALLVEQQEASASVPLEDIAVIILDQPQASLTVPVLSACAEQGIAVLSVDTSHVPNGIFLPYLTHTRALKVMRAQLGLGVPAKKRIWQGIVRQKLRNQAAVLRAAEDPFTAHKLTVLVEKVRSGDSDNQEAHGARLYFSALFARDFTRAQSRFYNAALNYGYAIIRSALARSLVGYGFLPAFGLHHHSEQNAFNLADDLIEPYRPLVDLWVLQKYPLEPERDLATEDKACLATLLHQDAPRLNGEEIQGSSTLLALIEATVISLAQRLRDARVELVLPGIPGERDGE